MNKTFKYTETIPDCVAYHKLFESTGWNQAYLAGAHDLEEAISKSWYTICAYNDEDALIVFGRVVSDSVLYGFICDMIIEPGYQNQGIGSTIIKKLIQKCKEANIRVLWLFAAAEKSGFYKKFGFVERPKNAPGMQLNLNIADNQP